ncbi:MAG: type II toxin-antitoxin system RelE/ParE family toxin [Microcoleus sp. PH2017_06_SFM_O_A]|nr:type II toxin-antitoxin system RelE/ParE family toxin [Microcoleus sp. PH2017_06_SFM_O_A]
MSDRLIVKNRATQDLRQQANYILVNGNARAAERFLELAEASFAQLATIPGMGKVVRLISSRMGEIRQWRIKDFQDYLISGFKTIGWRFSVFCMVLGIWKIFCLILMKKFKAPIRCFRSPLDTGIRLN